MTAVSTFWWAASFNSLEYESVLTFLWAKSGGMMKMANTNAIQPIIKSRRRASGAMGLSPPGTYFL